MPSSIEKYRWGPSQRISYERCDADFWKDDSIRYAEQEREAAIQESITEWRRPTKRPEAFWVENEFARLANQWTMETKGFSVTAQKYAHKAYHAILVLGAQHPKKVITLILEELRARPGRWFEALKLISNEDPVGSDLSFDEATRAWVAWGIAEKYIR